MSAINYIGEGPLTASIGIVAATIPDTPAAPTRTTAGLTFISIAWIGPFNGGSALISYIIQRNAGTGSTSYTTIDTIASTNLAYTNYGLTTGQQYKFKIIAVNSVGQSIASPASLDITSALAPESPGDPTYASSSKTSISFTWVSP